MPHSRIRLLTCSVSVGFPVVDSTNVLSSLAPSVPSSRKPRAFSTNCKRAFSPPARSVCTNVETSGDVFVRWLLGLVLPVFVRCCRLVDMDFGLWSMVFPDYVGIRRVPRAVNRTVESTVVAEVALANLQLSSHHHPPLALQNASEMFETKIRRAPILEPENISGRRLTHCRF
jgi:hypothetical protein